MNPKSIHPKRNEIYNLALEREVKVFWTPYPEDWTEEDIKNYLESKEDET